MSNLSTDKAQGTLSGVFDSIKGISKSYGVSPIGLIGKKGDKQRPGFTPPEPDWYEDLLKIHPDYRPKEGETQILYFKKNTSDRFDETIDKNSTDFKDYKEDPYRYYSTRDHYLIFNDSSTDYFKHGLHIIDRKTPLKSDKNDRETWDGSNADNEKDLRLSQFTGTPYENTDPVIFGFELVIDSVSSPLLNGSVEDFIDQFNNISEVASRKAVISDFKRQFVKLFKTNSDVFGTKEPSAQKTISIPTSNYSNTDSNTKIYQPGKKAYMSYYLKKIDGLNLLIESNSAEKKKYITDYRKDVLKFTFNEDISLSLGTLSHLYKLLYWSKPMGKNIIPENLLRFNCSIIISEVRNLNRVRKALDKGDLEVIKDNLSRHIYSLSECQFWFDQSPHDSDIDLSQASKEFDSLTVTMDFKYVTSKFERWVPNGEFGEYVGYNNGAIWKIGNPGSRAAAGTTIDTSIPKFFSVNSNSLSQNGINAAIVLKDYNKWYHDADKKAPEKIHSSSALKNLANNLINSAGKELAAQINIRTKLLNSTLDKIRNASYIPHRMKEPRNIYKGVYKYDPWDFKNEGLSTQFFFDVQNSIKSFGGEALGNNIVGNTLFGGNRHTV